MIKIKYVINQIKNIINKQNNVWNKRTYIIITILFETQSNIEKFLNGMVIRCWRNAYYFFSVSFVSPTSVDNVWSSSGGEKECKRRIKNFYCKWLSYYNQMILVAGNLLFVKCISWSQNDYNWTFCCIEVESHTFCLPHTLSLLHIPNDL